MHIVASPPDYNATPHISYNRFGPDQIESALGQGAVAIVYAVLDRTGKRMVLKVLMRQAAAQAQVRSAFQREYRTLSRLRHRNIVNVYSMGEVEGYFYMAMERIDGETLDQFLIRNKKIGEAAAIGTVRQIASALEYIHSQGFVHRDIKPSNILLARDGRIVLFDFGTVLDMNSPTEEETLGVYGTPAFLAPEQIRDGDHIDGRADLYALGIMLYLMVVGRKPFYGGRSEVLDAHLHQTPPPPSNYGHLSPDLERVILKAIAKDPTDRYQTGGEFMTALESITPAPEAERVEFPGRVLRWFRSS